MRKTIITIAVAMVAAMLSVAITDRATASSLYEAMVCESPEMMALGASCARYRTFATSEACENFRSSIDNPLLHCYALDVPSFSRID